MIGNNRQQSAKLIHHGVTEANEGDSRDAVLGGHMESWDNVPGNRYKVSKESGLHGAEDSEELDLSEVDVGDKE